MNIETKTIRASSSFEATKEEYGYFGWKHTEDTTVRSGKGHRAAYVLARDKDMRNYYELAKLEIEYFDLRSSKKTYTPMEAGTVFLSLLLFIVPGVIYIAAKWSQKQRIAAHNAEIQMQMNVIASKAKKLL